MTRLLLLKNDLEVFSGHTSDSVTPIICYYLHVGCKTRVVSALLWFRIVPTTSLDDLEAYNRTFVANMIFKYIASERV